MAHRTDMNYSTWSRVEESKLHIRIEPSTNCTNIGYGLDDEIYNSKTVFAIYSAAATARAEALSAPR